MKLLTKEEQKSYENPKISYICKKKIYLKDKKYRKARGYCHYTGQYRGTARSIWNLKYSEPKNVSHSFS